MAEYAYTAGCYQAYSNHCMRVNELPLREKCLTEQLERCETLGKRFRASFRGGVPATEKSSER